MQRSSWAGIISVSALVCALVALAMLPQPVSAGSDPPCPSSWPGQWYDGPLRAEDYGTISHEGHYTDADGQGWFVIRGSDSNGYTIVRAYPASSDDDVAFDSPDQTCYLMVRRPGDSEDAAEPRQLIFPEEKTDPPLPQSPAAVGPAPFGLCQRGRGRSRR